MTEPQTAGSGDKKLASPLPLIVMVILFVVGIVTVSRMKTEKPKPPDEIANDPLLVMGYERFMTRCVNCHGLDGKGDGPLARGLSGPPPGNLTDQEWKHGDKPEQVLAVLTNGVKGAAMQGWTTVFDDDEMRAVAAYVYHLGGRPVPDVLRRPKSGQGKG